MIRESSGYQSKTIKEVNYSSTDDLFGYIILKCIHLDKNIVKGQTPNLGSFMIDGQNFSKNILAPECIYGVLYFTSQIWT